jgi:uncharacterized integral membrane protein
MRTWGTVVVGIVFAVLLVSAVLSNTQDVIVALPLVEPWRTKLWAALVASAVFGAAASLILVTWPLMRLKLQSRKHSKRIAQLEQEVHGLRTLPIANDAASSSSAQKV